MKTTIAILLCLVAVAVHAQPKGPVFPILLSDQNEPLLTNATYRGIFGTKVMFIGPEGLQGFEVTNLNSNVLAKLHIDPAAAEKNKAEIERKKQAAAVADALQAKEKLKRDAEFLEKQHKQDVEKAKRDEIARQKQFQENLQKQSADAETTRAQAAAKEAEASRIRAVLTP